MTNDSVIFADSSFLIALLSADDEWHVRAVSWQQRLQRDQCHLVTTEAILWEWLNRLSPPPCRGLAHSAYLRLRADRGITVTEFDAAVIEAAVGMYGARTDKGWSLTDCLSFHVMQTRGIVQALTADHHFEQAGFTALLLRDPAP